MVAKLLKRDLKSDFSRPLVFFVLAVSLSIVSRGFAELGKIVAFFNIINMVCKSVAYALIGNVIFQSFIMPLVNFRRKIYGDESYLTHTLPVTKGQIIFSKTLSAVIVVSSGLLVAILCAFILAYSSASTEFVKNLILQFFPNYNAIGIILLFVAGILLEILFFYNVVASSIILSNRHGEKRGLWAIGYILLEEFIMFVVTMIALVLVFLFRGELSLLFANDIVFAQDTVVCLLGVASILYIFAFLVLYFINKKVFEKGVNVD